MTISVLILAYSSEKTIEMTLDSVLRQTLKADEILVVNAPIEISSEIGQHRQNAWAVRLDHRAN